MLPHITVWTESVHRLPSVGTLTQVTLVWVVLVGQLPQFDDRMLKLDAKHPKVTGIHLKVTSLWLTAFQLILCGGGKGTAPINSTCVIIALIYIIIMIHTCSHIFCLREAFYICFTSCVRSCTQITVCKRPETQFTAYLIHFLQNFH